MVASIKRESSKWITANRIFPDFNGWNDEYFAATCSVENEERIIGYIKHQKSHHANSDFMTEIMNFYSRNNIEWNDNVAKGWE